MATSTRRATTGRPRSGRATPSTGRSPRTTSRSGCWRAATPRAPSGSWPPGSGSLIDRDAAPHAYARLAVALGISYLDQAIGAFGAALAEEPSDPEAGPLATELLARTLPLRGRGGEAGEVWRRGLADPGIAPQVRARLRRDFGEDDGDDGLWWEPVVEQAVSDGTLPALTGEAFGALDHMYALLAVRYAEGRADEAHEVLGGAVRVPDGYPWGPLLHGASPSASAGPWARPAGALVGEAARYGGRMEVVTAHGPAEVVLDEVDAPAFLLVLTHGSNGSVDAPDLLAVRETALGLGGAVARVTQPFRFAGRRAPGSPVKQDEAWLEIIGMLRERFSGVPLVQGGRSNGARVACRTAQAAGAGAWWRWRSRCTRPASREDAGRRTACGGVEVLVVNGDRDPFGVPDEADAAHVAVLAGSGTT